MLDKCLLYFSILCIVLQITHTHLLLDPTIPTRENRYVGGEKNGELVKCVATSVCVLVCDFTFTCGMCKVLHQPIHTAWLVCHFFYPLLFCLAQLSVSRLFWCV